jgi:hypothetical protein
MTGTVIGTVIGTGQRNDMATQGERTT